MNVNSSIDVTDPQYHGRPLWCVYGPDCFPTLFCCKVTMGYDRSLNIWGYSVYRRQAGFRTLGLEVTAWAAKSDAVFFSEHSAAIAHITELTTPKVKA